MKNKSVNVDTILNMARKKGILRVRDVTEKGVHPEYLRRLVDKGLLIRRGRGLYSLSDVDVTSDHSLAEAAKRIPKGIICLLSALRFHEIGSQSPHQVWIALKRASTGRPRVDYPPVHIVVFSKKALTEGIDEHNIEGVIVRIYNPAKTVADCFKYRNKIGLDVAIEALRDCWRQKQCTMDDLWYYAQICRVSNVMRPYLESLV